MPKCKELISNVSSEGPLSEEKKTKKKKRAFFFSDEGPSLETLENYFLHFGITQTFPIIPPRLQHCNSLVR